MKSLEHVIRDIREGKCECEKKKESLEHTIRKVRKAEYESSFGAKDSKPVDEASVGVTGTDKFQGNEFKSIRTATPHIKPPGPEHGHSQAPENVSRQRSITKEKAGINRVTEEEQVDEASVSALRAVAPIVEPLAGRAAAAALGPAAGVASMIPLAKDIAKRTAEKYKIQHKDFVAPKEPEIHPETSGVSAKSSFEKMKSFKFEAPTKTKPVDEPEVAAAKAKAAGKKAAEEKAKAPPAEEQPKSPEVSVKRQQEFVPQKDAAVAAPQPKTPQGPVLPPPTPAQTRPGETKTPATKTVPVEIPAETKPAPAAEPTPKKWKEVGPPMPAETKPAPAEAKPVTKAEPKAATQTQTQTDIGTKVAAGAAAATAGAVAGKVASDAATKAKTAETTNGKKGRFPNFGLPSFMTGENPAGGVGPRHLSPWKTHLARHMAMKEDTKSREEIENMPRKGDRKSIEYVGRKDADPKSTKEKTSRLATIKNVIDEAKQLKTAAEMDKPTKVFDYNKGDYIIINPNPKRNDLGVDDGNKVPKDYDNK